MRVLLIDGDIESAEKICSEMHEHFIVDVAYNGEEGAYLSQVNDYAAIIIEPELPDIKAEEVCKLTRKYDVESPILMLLEDSCVEKTVAFLESGADVILNKPFDSEKLSAYVRALIKRAYKKQKSSWLKVSDLRLNMRTKEVFRDKKQIHLRRKEYEILELLLLNKGRVVSKRRLLEHIWEDGLYVFSNTLEVHVKNLRDKIDRPFGKESIKTVYGFGYKVEN